MDPVYLVLLAFAAAFLLVLAANAVLTDLSSKPREVRERINAEIRAQQQDRIRRSLALKDVRRTTTDDENEPPSWSQRMTFMIEQSGLRISLRGLLLTSLLLGLVAGGVAAVLPGSAWFSPLIGGVAALLPVVHVQLVRRKRLERLREQLPETFDLMSRVLRAGQTMSQALQSVAEEFTEPVAQEFGYCYEQMNLGLHPEAALRDLAHRTGLLEIRIFVLAVVVHRQTGGNLAELLDKLSTVVRDRFRIQGMVQSLTAQGRLQASILLGLPVFMFGLLMVIRPEYEMVLFEYPALLISSIASMALGAFWIRRIVNFDF